MNCHDRNRSDTDQHQDRQCSDEFRVPFHGQLLRLLDPEHPEDLVEESHDESYQGYHDDDRDDSYDEIDQIRNDPDDCLDHICDLGQVYIRRRHSGDEAGSYEGYQKDALGSDPFLSFGKFHFLSPDSQHPEDLVEEGDNKPDQRYHDDDRDDSDDEIDQVRDDPDDCLNHITDGVQVNLCHYTGGETGSHERYKGEFIFTHPDSECCHLWHKDKFLCLVYKDLLNGDYLEEIIRNGTETKGLAITRPD